MKVGQGLYFGSVLTRVHSYSMLQSDIPRSKASSRSRGASAEELVGSDLWLHGPPGPRETAATQDVLVSEECADMSGEICREIKPSVSPVESDRVQAVLAAAIVEIRPEKFFPFSRRSNFTGAIQVMG